MSAIQTALFDYGIMPVNDAFELKSTAERIKLRLKRTAEDIIEIGRELITAKEKCGHGNFEKWLSVEFDMSNDSAQRFMNVAKTFSGEKPHSAVFELNAKALYMLSAPSLKPEIQQAIIAKVEAGESVDVKAEILRLKDDLKLANAQADAYLGASKENWQRIDDLKKEHEAEKKQLQEKINKENLLLNITQQTVNKYKSDAEKFEAEANRLNITLAKKVDQIVAKKLDEKVAEKLEVEKEKLQAEVDRIAEELEQDFMERNGQLQNELSELKSQLASEQNPVLMAKLNAQLFAVEENLKAKREELEKITVLKNQAVYEKLLIQMSTQVNETVAAYRSALLAAGNSTLPIEDKTFNLLMDASEELEKLAKLFFDIANPKNLTIEINDDEKMAA